MKLKSMLLGGLFLIPLFSCENREEVTTVQIETELVAEIQVVSETNVSPGLKSEITEDEFSFSGTGIFCLAQNKEFGKPMCTVQNVKPLAGCKLLFANAGTEGKISSMKLIWGFKNKDEMAFVMQDEIGLSLLPATQKNEGIEFDLTGVINPVVNCIDCNPACMYRFDITGKADFSVPSQALLTIPVSAEEKVYNVQFSLF
jgi:hypothetical protein